MLYPLRARRLLFPAHAGVIPSTVADLADLRTVPRTRGGDPLTLLQIAEAVGCSPHTRG